MRLTLPPRARTASARRCISAGSRMPSRSGSTGMPSWQSRVVNWRSGERARWAARRAASPVSNASEHQAGQHEVVGPVAVRGELLVGGIESWTSGSTTRPSPVGDADEPVDRLPDLGLDHEAARARLLDDVADGVQAHDPHALRGEGREPVARSARRVASGPQVEVDLLGPVGRPERGPDRRRSPVSPTVMVEKGCSGLRRKMRATSSAGGRPSGQTLSSVMNRSAYARSPAVPLEVLELLAPAADVIDHQVEEHVVVGGERADVRPGPERGSISR